MSTKKEGKKNANREAKTNFHERLPPHKTEFRINFLSIAPSETHPGPVRKYL